MIMHIPFAAMIGPVLATVRALTGKSQVAFAEPVGVAGGQFSRYERSKQIPDIEVAMRLLAAGGWRFAAISDDEAATLEEREAVITAVRRFSAVARGDDVSLSEPAALSQVFGAMNRLDDAERDTRNAGKPPLAEELVRARLTLAEQRAQIDELLPCVERLTTERDRLLKVMRTASEIMLTETDGPQ